MRISSIEEFLEAGAEKKGRQGIATKCDISEKLVLNWVNRADLAQRDAVNLHEKMGSINEEKNLVRQDK